MIVKPGTGDAVGLAATRMAADPELAKSGQYIPKTDAVLFHTKMVPPIAGETLRFMAPKTPRLPLHLHLPWPLDHYERRDGGEVDLFHQLRS